MFYYGCLYEKGGRPSNQDSIALHKIVTEYGETVLAMVCDGMGGMQEGETASGYVAEKISCWFYEELPYLLERRANMKIISRSLCRKIFHLHMQLKEYGKKKKIKLGTTASILLLHQKKYVVCHVGDSAVFRLEKNPFFLLKGDSKSMKIKRLTKLHGNPAAGLDRCVGSGRYETPDIIIGGLHKETAFMLHSDGLGHYLSEDEVRNAFCDGWGKDTIWAEKRLHALAAKAMRRGETDNISAIYLGQGKEKGLWKKEI